LLEEGGKLIKVKFWLFELNTQFYLLHDAILFQLFIKDFFGPLALDHKLVMHVNDAISIGVLVFQCNLGAHIVFIDPGMKVLVQ
jgi:hypothetical protein